LEIENLVRERFSLPLRQAPAIGDTAAEAAWVNAFQVAAIRELPLSGSKKVPSSILEIYSEIAYKIIAFTVLNQSITAFEFW
jgi:hypothetical protein